MFTRVNQSDLMAFSPNIKNFPLDLTFNVSHTDDGAATFTNTAVNNAAQVDEDPDAITLAADQRTS